MNTIPPDEDSGVPRTQAEMTPEAWHHYKKTLTEPGKEQIEFTSSSFNKIHEITTYNGSHQGRFLAIIEVIKGLLCLTIPMWNEPWKKKVDALWWGKTKASIRVPYEKDKKLADLNPTHHPANFKISHLFSNDGLPLKSSERLFTQFFGPGSYENALKAHRFLEIKSWDNLENAKSLLDLLEEAPPESHEIILRATKKIIDPHNRFAKGFYVKDLKAVVKALDECIQVHTGSSYLTIEGESRLVAIQEALNQQDN